MTQLKKRFPAKLRAFSLVEVVLALGIVAIALPLLIGLLPVSMNSYLNAKRDTVRANIMQDIAANANMTPFLDLSNSSTASGTTPGTGPGLVGFTTTYDDQGEPASVGGVYVVTTSVAFPTNLPGQSSFIAGGAYGTTNVYAVRVSVTSPGSVWTNTIYIANQGK